MTKICTGCGIKLQSLDKQLPGYIDNIEKNICERCFKLSNYGEYQKVSLSNNDYLKIINNINKNNLVIYVTDILDLNLDNINMFNKTLLLITKRDILPKSIKDEKIIKYIKEKHQNIQDIIIISSIHNYNLDTLYNKIKEYKNNNPIYIVGATNSGKSTLINKLIKNYSNKDTKITTSMYPSTTLDKISISLDEFTIIDTPGLINKNSIINYIEQKELKKILNKKEIKPKTCQISGIGSIIIDKYLRIDYETNQKNSMVIYISNNLNTRFNNINNNNLKEYTKKELTIDNNKDIVIEGLGFIKFTKKIKLNIYVYNDLEIKVRDNLI